MSIVLGDTKDTKSSRASSGQMLVAMAVIALLAAITVGVVFACRKASSSNIWLRATGLRSAANQGFTASTDFEVVSLTVPFGPTGGSVVQNTTTSQLTLTSSGVYSAEVSANVVNAGATATDVTLNLEVVKSTGTVNYPFTVTIPDSGTKVIAFNQLFEVAAGAQPATMTMQIKSSDESISVLSTDTFMAVLRVGGAI